MKKIYAILENEDGTVDVYLRPEIQVYRLPEGQKEYDGTVGVIRGIVPWNGMEEDIRRRFDDWCAEAARIDI